MGQPMSDYLWRRLAYQLSPQLTIYRNLAPLVKDSVVLEVGFCTGFGTLQYAWNAVAVRGIETDELAVNFAQENMPIANVTWDYGDIATYEEGRYDAIVMLEVLEHIPDWKSALEGCERLLTPNGKLIVSTPNANGSFIKNELHGGEWTAREFHDKLSTYFNSVTLYDFTLTNEQGLDTIYTPMVAICRKGQSDNS